LPQRLRQIFGLRIGRIFSDTQGPRELVATLGLLPAALSRGIGSDSQRPFAIVIVGGLLAALFISIYLLPTMYAWVARDTDQLPLAEAETEENI